MIDPPLNELCEKVDCRYTLVSVISKRARQIVEQSSTSDEGLQEKAVSYAVDDLMTDRLEFHRKDESTIK